MYSVLWLEITVIEVLLNGILYLYSFLIYLLSNSLLNPYPLLRWDEDLGELSLYVICRLKYR